MITLTATSANELFTAVCGQVLEQGHRTSPRGQLTKEILGAHLTLTNPRQRFVAVPPARLLNPAFAVAEVLWILAGSDEPWIFDFNRNLAQYADDGRLRGAYGPRIRLWRGEIDQLTGVRELLRHDPDSRQAVIQLYDPQLDTQGNRDVPCTLNYRFFVRAGQLHMHTTMRSNDVWLGLPYDLFAATILHELMAGWLDVDLGSYHHHVDSLHLYAHDWDGAAEVARTPTAASTAMPPLVAPPDDLTRFLGAVIAGEAPMDADPIWHAMGQVLESYRRWNSGDRTSATALADSLDGDLGVHLHAWYEHLTARTHVTSTKAAIR
ncbi:thymidylate synthase [Cryptosporangium phraense]|uniref:Thymidylate synthase n=1 Tax=Cryptosporangium phraense TaxID=2593070 RepID=A0A545AKG3_9ACTN|nr:thymidylate synthase [Cryptosporangium phraense]TQS41817.1 thymidylate synthase [Cryptosporangium phraense]